MKTFRNIYKFLQDIDFTNETRQYHYQQLEKYPDINIMICRNELHILRISDGQNLLSIIFDIDRGVIHFRALYDSNGCLKIDAKRWYEYSINTSLDELNNHPAMGMEYLHEFIKTIPETNSLVLETDLRHSSVIMFDGDDYNLDYSYAIVSNDESNMIIYHQGTYVAVISKDSDINGELVVLYTEQLKSYEEAHYKWFYLTGKSCKITDYSNSSRNYNTEEFLESAKKNIGRIVGNSNLY